MADLYIDGAVLARMRADLLRIEDMLERPVRELAQLDESCVGTSELRARMGEFSEEWSYGIGQLGKFSGDASAALTRVETVFEEVEATLSRALGARGRVVIPRGCGGARPAPPVRARESRIVAVARAGVPGAGFRPEPG